MTTYRHAARLRAAQAATFARNYIIEKAGRIPALCPRSEPGPDFLRVSLTTYPPRVPSAVQAINTIFTQRHRPDAVTLVLSRDEFDFPIVPGPLRSLQEAGLDVLWAEGNDRSYKKLLPTLLAHPHETIVTADDDFLYPRWWLSELWNAHIAQPTAILGHRGKCILPTKPYLAWPHAKRSTPSMFVFLTNGAGTLFPPGSLPSEAHNMEVARSLCPTADDVWFKGMALLNGTTTAMVTDDERDFPPTWRTGDPAGLAATNVYAGQNDHQIQALFTYFDLWKRFEL